MAAGVWVGEWVRGWEGQQAGGGKREDGRAFGQADGERAGGRAGERANGRAGGRAGETAWAADRGKEVDERKGRVVEEGASQVSDIFQGWVLPGGKANYVRFRSTHTEGPGLGSAQPGPAAAGRYGTEGDRTRAKPARASRTKRSSVGESRTDRN